MKKQFSLPAILVLLAVALSGCYWYGPGGYDHAGWGGGYGGGGYHQDGDGDHGGGWGGGGGGGGWHHGD